jgi:integral membrane protein (TIGR00529 family)
MFCLGETEFLTALKLAAGSSLAATLAAFGLILLLTRLKVPLSIGILAGAVALDLLFGRGAVETVRLSVLGAVQPQTIGLVVIVVMMLALSETMRRAGQLDEIVALARPLLRRPAVAMAALPALIGLMPMPGGAQLSAPMVEAAAGGTKVAADRLSAINYWFRHIWEHFWPLYPGVMVTLSLTRSDAASFALHQFPLSILMVLSGLLIFWRSDPDLHRGGAAPRAGQARKLFWATSTIWVILIVWGAVRAMLSLRRYGPLAAGLAVSLLWTARMNRLTSRDVLAVVKRPSIYKLAAVVVSVMVFWYAIQQAGAAGRIAAELADLHVPAEVVVAVLPFIAGLMTGLAVGFAGTSFPIVLAVVAAMPGEPSIRPYVALAYSFGHLGQMLSPLHICQILSNEYFSARSRTVYRRLMAPAAAMAVLSVAYFLLLKLLVG